MPLIYKVQTDNDSLVGVWRIDESVSFFLEQLAESTPPAEKLQSRQLEKLGVRHLLNQLSAKFLHRQIDYDSFGKPHLINGEHYISFSHKKKYVAVVLSKNNPHTGIDIEKAGELPVKLAPKFISERDSVPDSEFTPEQKCALIWSAKECLYKVYGKKELDFREHLSVKFETEKRLLGTIRKNGFVLDIPMTYSFVEDLVLVHTL